MDKIKKLKKILKQMGSVLIAYSGGVDSTFLLKIAGECLGNKVLAVTAVSKTYPKEELSFAKEMARSLKIRHMIIKTDELEDKNFVLNPLNRCYFCKKELFSQLQKLALEFKLNFVADASNLSDKRDFRPGNQAKKEFKVRSPLQEAGFYKEDIRRFSKKLGLDSWNKPSLACLASRIPYGTKITPKLLARINQGEKYLRYLGFNQVRLRHYNSLCRIEVPQSDIIRIINNRCQIINRFKKIGYNYVTVDLEGYRTGSMNAHTYLSAVRQDR
jgi:uncharacterized protein